MSFVLINLKYQCNVGNKNLVLKLSPQTSENMVFNRKPLLENLLLSVSNSTLELALIYVFCNQLPEADFVYKGHRCKTPHVIE